MLIVIGLFTLLFPAAYEAARNPRSSEISPQLEATPSGALVGLPSNQVIRIHKDLLTTKSVAEAPLRIVIPAYQVDLPIQTSRVIEGYWELSETTASFGLGSAFPGEKGNTVVFAHARKGLFLPLRDIRKGTDVYLLTSHLWYRYRVTETKLVDPNRVEEVSPTEDEILTLFTCSGFLDSKRLIVTATPLRP